MTERWYRSLSNVPRVGYQSDPKVNRAALKWAELKPTRISSSYDKNTSLVWRYGETSSGASPAHGSAFSTLNSGSKKKTAAILRDLAKTLELPGIASDYHFAIGGVAMGLWARRHDEPTVLNEFERLCWLDIRLAEALPDSITFERGTGTSSYPILSFPFHRLATLYEHDGALIEALDVAERGERLGQGTRVAELRERVLAMTAEDT